MFSSCHLCRQSLAGARIQDISGCPTLWAQTPTGRAWPWDGGWGSGGDDGEEEEDHGVLEDTLEQIVQLVRKLNNVLEGAAVCRDVHEDDSEQDDGDCIDAGAGLDDDGGGGVDGEETVLILYFDLQNEHDEDLATWISVFVLDVEHLWENVCWRVLTGPGRRVCGRMAAWTWSSCDGTETRSQVPTSCCMGHLSCGCRTPGAGDPTSSSTSPPAPGPACGSVAWGRSSCRAHGG